MKLDLTGLNCPLPVLKTKKLLAELPSGEEVTIITSDPMAEADLQDFCRKSGNDLIKQQHEGNLLITMIKRR